MVLANPFTFHVCLEPKAKDFSVAEISANLAPQKSWEIRNQDFFKHILISIQLFLAEMDYLGRSY